MDQQMDQLSAHLSFLPEWAVGPVIAALTIFIGYFIAKIAAWLVSSTINKTGLGRQAKSTGGNIGKSLSKAVFWVIWLVFILLGLSQFPMVADALQPIEDMLSDIFAYIPQLFVGIFVLAIGVILSRVVRETVSSTLEAAQVDQLAIKYGFAGSEDANVNAIARSAGSITGAIVLIIFAITAIGIWDIPGISGPVSDMLTQILNYIPNILVFGIIMAITVYIARFVSNLAKSTLPALGIDDSLKSIGAMDGVSDSKVVPSNIIANIAFIAIMLLGLTAATSVLGIPELTNVFNTLMELGGRIVLGSVIIGAGIFIANFVGKIVTDTSGAMAGNIVKYATMLIVTFMGLDAMDLGSDIVDSAFRYTVMAGAVALGVGGALAFGLGGREWAAKKLNQWMPPKK